MLVPPREPVPHRFDVIIVGARAAGASLGAQLARSGMRVLVLDRARFPSDTVSTHLLQPRACSYLKKWGLLDRVLAVTPSFTHMRQDFEGIHVSGSPPQPLLERRLAAVHGGDASSYATVVYAAPRRIVVDEILVVAAREAGAEVREGVTVDGLLTDGDRVVGVRTRSDEGVFEERAPLVVGADGRHSTIAKLLRLPKLRERPVCTVAYYAYWSGLNLEGLVWPATLRGRFTIVAYPTNDNAHLVLVFGPGEWFHDFRAAIERNYHKIIDWAAPALGERLREATRVSRFFGTADQAAFYRASSGPGWVLVGDAGCCKDQCTAIGMTHAFRDVTLLHAALQSMPADAAAADYERRRNEDASEYYDFVCRTAELHPPRLDQVKLFAGLSTSPGDSDRFEAMFADILPVSEFQRDAKRLVGQGADHPAVRTFDDREYGRNPFV